MVAFTCQKERQSLNKMRYLYREALVDSLEQRQLKTHPIITQKSFVAFRARPCLHEVWHLDEIWRADVGCTFHHGYIFYVQDSGVGASMRVMAARKFTILL